MNKWIRKGDRVLVCSGNDKGKVGEVLARRQDRVVVQGVNLRKKHLRRTEQSPGGRIVEMEASIHISNVCLSSKEGKRLKIRVQTNDKGEKELVDHSSKKPSVYRSVKKPA